MIPALIIGGALAAGALASNLKSSADAKNARQSASNSIDNWNTDANILLNNYEVNQQKFSNDGDLEKYQQLKDSYDPNDYVYDFDEFDTSKYNVEDYLNADKDSILADIAKASQATAAGSALGHSAGAQAIANKAVASKSEELLNNAYERMNTEKNFDYTAYNNYIQNMQNKLNTLNSGVQTQMNNLKSDLQFDQEQEAQNVQNRLSLGNSVAQSKASLV